MQTPYQQTGALKYLCKSVDHTAFVYREFGTRNLGDLLGIQHRGTDGAIHVKRVGTTQNISLKARRKAGWKEHRSPEEVSALLNPPKGRRQHDSLRCHG
jgi:hypothetical protein